MTGWDEMGAWGAVARRGFVSVTSKRVAKTEEAIQARGRPADSGQPNL